MVLATARANKPRDGWSTSLRNADDDDSDDDGSSSPSAASRPPPAEGSDWDWNWSSELIDIGLVDEPAHLRFVETPFTLAKRNALTKRAAAETETLANTEKRKKLATTPAAAASAKKAKPATTTTTPAPPHQSAALKKTQGSSPPPSDGQQQAVPPISSQPSLPKDPLRATPIAQQQSREETPSSKARLISSSRFRPASMSTSSPTVFSSSSSSQSPSSSSATDKAALAIAATAETETESGQASPAAGLSSTKSTARVEHPLGTTAASLTPPSNRLPQAAPSTYSVGTGVVHKMPPNQAKISTLPCSASSSELACASPTTATKEDANDHDADDSPCLPPPPPSRRHRGDEQEGCSAAIAGTFAAPVNVNKRLPTAKLNKSDAVRRPPSPPTNMPFVSPLVGRQRPLKLQQQQSFPEHEGEEDDATRSLAVASAVHPRPQQQQQKRSRVGDRDLLFPQAIKAPPSSSSFSTATAGPASSSGRAPSSSSTTTTTTTMTESNSLRTTRGYREGISPETRKRLDRFKRVGNFSCSSSSTLASASSSTAAEVGTDSGRLLTLSRRGDDDGPCLDPTTTPMPDRSALESGEPVNNNNVDPGPGSSIRKVSTSTTKFSLPGFGTGSGGVVGSSLQTKKKRSRLDFTPDEPLEVFRQKKKKKKKKNAHGPLLSSSSSPFPHDNDGAWNGVEPVSPSPLHPTGAPFQQRQQRPQPKRETIVLGAAVRSVRPVSLAGTTGNTLNTLNNNNKVGTSSSSLLPKRQTGGFKRPLAAARTRGNLIIRDDDNDDDDEEERASHEGEDAKRRRLYRSLGL